MLHLRIKEKLVLLFLIKFLVFQAQDGQYWTNAFGPKSVLLSGAVVGGVNDFSASYYNPAGLALADSAGGIAISCNAYNDENIVLKNAAGNGKDLRSNNFQSIPLIVTGKLNFKNKSAFSIGYYVVQRQKSLFKSSERHTGMYDLVDNSVSAGEEEYTAQYNSNAYLQEMAAGLSAAYKISTHYAVGLSVAGIYRSHKIINNYLTRLVPVSQGAFFTSSYTRLEDLEYQNLRLTPKLAFMADHGRFKTGLTVTLPSTNLWGMAIVGYDIAYTNTGPASQGQPTDFFADDRQVLKKTVYKDPLSIAWGGEIQVTRGTVIYLTAEWFASQRAYTLVQPQPAVFTRPSSADEINSADYLRIRQGRKSLINYAIGFEQKLTGKINLLLGARTDYYSLIIDKNAVVKLNTFYSDLYHISLGGSYKQKKSMMYIGVLGSFGRKTGLLQTVNLNGPEMNTAQPLIAPLNTTREDTYRSVSFMLGYVYFIK